MVEYRFLMTQKHFTKLKEEKLLDFMLISVDESLCPECSSQRFNYSLDYSFMTQKNQETFQRNRLNLDRSPVLEDSQKIQDAARKVLLNFAISETDVLAGNIHIPDHKFTEVGILFQFDFKTRRFLSQDILNKEADCNEVRFKGEVAFYNILFH